MFGYVNAYKDLLRVCDYNMYRGYYCGLCKYMGKEFNQLTRLGLSYDMTFLAILISSLKSDKPVIKTQSCIAHPLTKKQIVYDDEGIAYSADIAVILAYLKLCDDWNDEKSLKSTASIVYRRHFKRLIKKYENKYSIIDENMKRLHSLEKENCKNIDEVADCFGGILETIFDIDGNSKPLAWLGYHTGRFIYIVDAFKDIDDDIKNNSYNPFVCAYGKDLSKEDLAKSVTDALTLTLSEISNAYNLLDIKKNKEILDNIIYLGMRKVKENLYEPI